MIKSDESKTEPDIHLYHQSLISVAYRILSDMEKAKDVVQDVYLKFLESNESFKGNSSMKTYLYRIVINRCIDIKRRNIRWFNIVEKLSYHTDLPDDKWDDKIDNSVLVRKLFDNISDTFRIPMILAEVDEMTYEEIADTLKISVNTVRTRIFRCREKVRQEFKKSGMSL